MAGAFEQALGQIKSTISEGWQRLVNTPKKEFFLPTSQAFRPVRQVGAEARAIPLDYKFRLADIGRTYQGVVKPHLTAPLPEFREPRRGYPKDYELTKEQKLKNLVFTPFEEPREKTPSADFNFESKFFFESPPQNPNLVGLKERTLAGPLLPGARRYAENIPFVENRGPEGTAAYAAFQYPHIAFPPEAVEAIANSQQYSPTAAPNPNSRFESPGRIVATGRHEVMHHLANVLYPDKKIEPFLVAFNQAAQTNPDKYKEILQWISGYEKNMPNYFAENPDARGQEIFAELGALYGPELLSDPFIGKYYRNIFRRVGSR